MDFISFNFYLFLGLVLILYYLIPLRFRWIILLGGSMFYFFSATSYRRECIVFTGVIIVSWILGLLQEHLYKMKYSQKARKLVLFLSIGIILVPLCLSKYPGLLYLAEAVAKVWHSGIVVSIGLSFFTMQIIAYLTDIYRGKVAAQHNLLKYALFVSFFPHILQGPIPRYDQLEPQLITGHKFCEKSFAKGFMLIIWGFFLKLMIADKAAVVVNTIFAEPDAYQGFYVLVGGCLYSIQLYADFLACTTFAQGTSELFNIHLADNFNHPYFSTSIKEFWGRWHISLSTWLRDYVYIPLGGNRKGKVRKYINLCITFGVSGIWHGTGWKYLVWGLMHAGYQILGELTVNLRNEICEKISIPVNSRKRTWLKCFVTFLLVMAAWVVFRANTLKDGLFMLRSLFTVYNPWIFFNDALLTLGLEWKEWNVFLISVMVLWKVSRIQEQIQIRNCILAQPFYLRLGLYATAIAVIIVLGTYGFGYNAADFIYGGF